MVLLSYSPVLISNTTTVYILKPQSQQTPASKKSHPKKTASAVNLGTGASHQYYSCAAQTPHTP